MNEIPATFKVNRIPSLRDEKLLNHSKQAQVSLKYHATFFIPVAVRGESSQ